MKSLFSSGQMEQINAVAAKSKEVLKPVKVSKSVTSSQHEIEECNKAVLEYFKDSPAILITTREELHEYVLNAIEAGYCGIDTETTGLDRIRDTIVGFSLYYPGGLECYIPCRHLVPIFETLYPNQITYEDAAAELSLFLEAKTKLIFANADYDLAMIYKDFKLDLIPICYYDVILAWRCLKEDEKDNGLKQLYWKYPNKGQGSPKRFTDFFSPALFPYSDPNIAKLYAANDAKITYDLFAWQLPFVTKSNPQCKKHHLEKIADLVWNIEFPMIRVCAMMHRTGIYFDDYTCNILKDRYHKKYDEEIKKLGEMVQEILDQTDALTVSKSPFKTGSQFNQASNKHMMYLLNKVLNQDVSSADKETLKELNLPITKQILNVRGVYKLLNTYIDKLPQEISPYDHRIHGTFKSIGAATGRMCIAKGTKITCLNGLKNIEDIVPGDLVYCYDNSGILQLKPVKNLWLTGKDRECVKIKWQSSGKGDVGELICTPEHLILKKSGEWARADSLTRYTKLAHLRRTEPTSGEQRPELYGWNGLETREQDVVKYSIFNAPSNMIIHHKDGNKRNNALSNLEIMSHSEHCKYHGKELQRLGIISANSMRTPEAIKHRTNTIKSNHIEKCIQNRDYYLKLIAEHNGRLCDIPYDFNCFKRNCQLAGIDVYAECAKYNSKYAWRTIPKDTYIDCYLRNDGSTTKIAKELNISHQTATTLREKYGKCLNHMVLSVTPAGNYDVYDIEVEDVHNFIANEICVHNSSERPNMQQIPSHAKDIRHQFRATPQLERTIEQLSSGSALELNLFSYDALDTADNGWKDIIDLCEGEDIILYCGKNTCIGIIDCIQHTLPNTYIRISLSNSTPQSYKLIYREPPYIMMSSDYSQQEPKILSFICQDKNMLKAFMEGKDIYATIASLAFNMPYERCLEHHPETHEYQPDGYARRAEAKTIVLGITYGRSTKTIGDQLFGGNKQMTDDEKTAAAQKIYDAVLNAFPSLRSFMLQSQANAAKLGYVETILGRRRHIPDMQLPRFQFVPDSKYVNPDIDPLDPSTLKNKNEIPERIVRQLEKEFNNYKYFGQIVKATKRLAEEHIKVINNSSKINDATRQVVNSAVQGSAAELTKIALLKLFANKEWEEIGGRMLVPVHDELIPEVPLRNADRGAEILSQMMQEAGNFLPFKISCDVTVTHRWYGREYPCQYDMPESLDNMSALTPSNISWIQYHLVEMEYILPTIPNEDGTALKGDPAVGINGVMCEDIESDIRDYCGKYRIDTSEFINHIYQKVNGYIVENR